MIQIKNQENLYHYHLCVLQVYTLLLYLIKFNNKISLEFIHMNRIMRLLWHMQLHNFKLSIQR